MLKKKVRRIKKDIVVRKNWNKKEFNNLLYKYNMSLFFLNFKFKNYIFFKFLKTFHLNSSVCRINSICVISGRAHWVLRKFRLSRMMFHQFVDYGYINGVKRSSF